MTNLFQNINRTVFCTFLFLALQLHAIAGSNDKALSFIENKGQITDQHTQQRDDIDFSINANGVNIFISNGKLQYQWIKTLTCEDSFRDNAPIVYNRIEMVLVGANTNIDPIVADKQPYYETHYLKHNGAEVRVHTYNRITYKNVYPNIDWVLYTKNGQLKYDFIVHPNGNISDIKLQYNGAENVTLKEGAIIASTRLGSITEQAPYTYDADTKTPIHSAFTLKGNNIGFEIATHKGTTIIDPYLEWATYHGGESNDWGLSTTADYLGNVYLMGHTCSKNNIATSGAFQDTLTLIIDTPKYSGPEYVKTGFIVKFNRYGQRIWTTYYPGLINAGVSDAIGTLYIAGECDSIPYIATQGAYQTNYNGPYNHYTPRSANQPLSGEAFIAKIDSSGSRVWGTFYGGEINDNINTITLSAKGYIYVGGLTRSNTNIASTTAYQDTINKNRTAYNRQYTNPTESSNLYSGFIAKFNITGARIWSTYYSGEVSNIVVDNNDDIVVVGMTYDSTGVGTNGAYKAGCTLNTGNCTDGFIAKFNSNGTRLWGTYYGGEQEDLIHSVSVDDSNNIYILGMTQSLTGLTTAGAHQTTTYTSRLITNVMVSNDVFIAKFSPNGASRIWGTYYGYYDIELSKSIKVGHDNKLYILGSTQSYDSLSTPGAISTIRKGSIDDFIARFDLNGNREWGSYLGGNNAEYYFYTKPNGPYRVSNYNTFFYSQSIDISPLGKIYIGGTTNSTSQLAFLASQPQLNAGYNSLAHDAYLMSISMDTVVYIKHPWSDSSFCVGDTLKVPYGVNVSFSSGNVFTVQLSDTDGSFTSPTNIGSLTATNNDTITCVIPQVPTGYEYRIRIVSSTPGETSADNQFNLTILAPPSSLTATNNGSLCIGDSLSLVGTHSGGTSTGLSYKWTGPNSFTAQQKDTGKLNVSLTDTGDYILTVNLQQCSISDTTHVDVYTIPAAPVASAPQLVCFDSSLSLSATHSSSIANYSWTGPNNFNSNSQNPTISNATLTNAGNYLVTATVNGCTSDADTVLVAIQQTPTPQAGSNSPVCAGQQIIFTASSISNATYSWHGPNNYTATQQNPSIPNATASRAGTYYVKATVNGCESLEDSVTISVAPPATVNIFPTPSDSICDGQTVSFVAITNNAGSNPTYSWLNGGSLIPGASSSTYSSNTLSNGASIQCIISNIANCPGHSDTGNMVVMTILPVAAPSVSITSSPNMPVAPFQLVTFTAQTTYGGNNPTFQWMRNGQPVIGATSSTWGTYQLSNGDSIYTILTGSYKCAEPDTAVSNTIEVLLLLSVDDVNQLGDVTLYPNPNNGTFTIKGKLNTNKEVNINIMNTIGQSVYRSTAMPNGYELNHTVNIGTQLAAGTYLLHLQSGDDVTTLRFIIQR